MYEEQINYNDANSKGQSQKYIWKGVVIFFNPAFLEDRGINYNEIFFFDKHFMRPVCKREDGFIECRVLELENKDLEDKDNDNIENDK